MTVVEFTAVSHMCCNIRMGHIDLRLFLWACVGKSSKLSIWVIFTLRNSTKPTR